MDVITLNEERGWNIRKAKLYGAFIGKEEGLGARYNRSFAEEIDLLLSHQGRVFWETFLGNFKKKNLILSHFGLILAMAELWHIHHTLNRKVTTLYTSRWSVVLSSFSVLI